MSEGNYETIGSADSVPWWAWLRRDSEEWETAWRGLCERDDTTPDAGDGWQYMGSFLKGEWYHDFRNRDLDGRRVYRRVKAESAP